MKPISMKLCVFMGMWPNWVINIHIGRDPKHTLFATEQKKKKYKGPVYKICKHVILTL